jgi:hypothetical protein
MHIDLYIIMQNEPREEAKRQSTLASFDEVQVNGVDNLFRRNKDVLDRFQGVSQKIEDN